MIELLAGLGMKVISLILDAIADSKLTAEQRLQKFEEAMALGQTAVSELRAKNAAVDVEADAALDAKFPEG